MSNQMHESNQRVKDLIIYYRASNLEQRTGAKAVKVFVTAQQSEPV